MLLIDVFGWMDGGGCLGFVCVCVCVCVFVQEGVRGGEGGGGKCMYVGGGEGM